MMFVRLRNLVESFWRVHADDNDADDSHVTTLATVTPGLATVLEAQGYTHVDDVRRASPRDLASACPMSYWVAVQIHADATDTDPLATIHYMAGRATAHGRDRSLNVDDSAAVDVRRWR
jgi:hypothetical protein